MPKLKRALRGGEKGNDVKMVQRALNRWLKDPDESVRVTSVFDAATQKRLKAFQAAKKISPVSGDFGTRSLNQLWPYFDAYGRQSYVRFDVPVVIPELGPVWRGGRSVLDQDCTHLTDVLGWPAWDDGFKAGLAVVAPEWCEVYDNTSGSQGGDAFYVRGKSGIQYWIAHINFVPALHTTFRKGQTMTTISSDHERPHVHVAINAMPLIGRHLESHDDYTHGAPLIADQLRKWLAP